MFFRNLTLFRFPTLNADLFVPREVNEGASFSLEAPHFEAALRECALKPVGALELASRGFVSPFGRDSEVLAHKLGDAVWIAVGTEEKILPAAVVNAELAKRMEAIEKAEGRKPGGWARKRMKEDLVHELLPKAFVRPGRTDAILLLDRGVLLVDTASRKVAENVVSELRHALGSFPALPINAEVAPRSVLTGWVAGEPLPEGVGIGDEVLLQDAASKGAKATLVRQEVYSDEVAKHLESGKQVTRLAISIDDHVSLTVGEDLVVRKFKLLDGAVESLANTEADDLRAELDARFALMAGEARMVFGVLERAFKVSSIEAEGGAAVERVAASPAVRRALDAMQANARAHGVSMTISGPGLPETVIGDGGIDKDGNDTLYAVAVRIVRETNRASISGVQRRLAIGYNRAARLIERMEAEGVVSPPEHNGDRYVLEQA